MAHRDEQQNRQRVTATIEHTSTGRVILIYCNDNGPFSKWYDPVTVEKAKARVAASWGAVEWRPVPQGLIADLGIIERSV